MAAAEAGCEQRRRWSAWQSWVSGFQSLQPVVHGHLQAAHLCNLKTKDHHWHHSDSKGALSSPVSASSSRNAAVLHQRGGDPSVPFANPSSMETATQRDPGFSKAFQDVYRFYGQTNGSVRTFTSCSKQH